QFLAKLTQQPDGLLRLGHIDRKLRFPMPLAGHLSRRSAREPHGLLARRHRLPVRQHFAQAIPKPIPLSRVNKPVALPTRPRPRTGGRNNRLREPAACGPRTPPSFNRPASPSDEPQAERARNSHLPPRGQLEPVARAE